MGIHPQQTKYSSPNTCLKEPILKRFFFALCGENTYYSWNTLHLRWLVGWFWWGKYYPELWCSDTGSVHLYLWANCLTQENGSVWWCVKGFQVSRGKDTAYWMFREKAASVEAEAVVCYWMPSCRDCGVWAAIRELDVCCVPAFALGVHLEEGFLA